MVSKKVLLSRTDHARVQHLIRVWAERIQKDLEQLERFRARMKAAIEVEPELLPASVVSLHAQVRVSDLDTGRCHVFTVVLPTDTEIAEGRCSPLSWLGTAILGAREGDELEWLSPSGPRYVRVEKVLFQPEAARRLVLTQCIRRRRAEGARSDSAHLPLKGSEEQTLRP